MRMRRHSSNRSPGDSLECNTAMASPNRERNQLIICGVSTISGTRMMAPLPCRRA